MLLDKAIQIAVQAHEGQKDKAGENYILHPLRVMLSLRTKNERICGILHDTVEDTYVTFDMLRKEGFPEEVIDVVDLLTRRETQTYEDFIERLLPNATACRVKLADLMDNSRVDRLKNPTSEDTARMKKYSIAIVKIQNQIDRWTNGWKILEQ